MDDTGTPASAPAPRGGDPALPERTRGDTLLVAVFWVWAAVLLLATLAQLLDWQGVLDVLDVKRWFAT